MGGLVWALVLAVAVGVAQVAAAVVMIPVAVVAAASGVRSLTAPPVRRSRTGRGGRSSALVLLAVVGSVVVPLAALAGTVPAVLAAVVLALAVVVGAAPAAGRRGGRAAALVVVVGPAVAALGVILARGQSTNLALALVAAALAYDAGAFMMGNARSVTGGPVGVVFGLVSVAVVAVFVAAVMNPPFSGVRPWVIFAVVGAMAATGVALGDRLLGALRSPALRRLDSLILAAPVWVIAVGIMGYH